MGNDSEQIYKLDTGGALRWSRNLGDTDGNLHQLNLATGTQTALQQVGDGTATVGSPAYDTYAQQLYAACTDCPTATPFRSDRPFVISRHRLR